MRPPRPDFRLVAVPVDAGARVRVEGNVEAIGLGTGSGATPDVVTWLPSGEVERRASGREIVVPTWSAADTVVVRPEPGGAVRVSVATRESAPLRWLRFEQSLATRLAAGRGAPLPEAPAAVAEYRKAKDIVRAARLPLLPRNNPGVKRHLGKVADGKLLSPVLLVRGDVTADRPLHIADGYHRVCAAYWLDENCPVACRLADF